MVAERQIKHKKTKPLVTVDPVKSARDARLRYATDDRPGITRKRSGKGFRYVAPDGDVVRDNEKLERIKSLGIPPAWSDVWINPDPRGHLQATGRDEKGRKQYRYHSRWRDVRDEVKYGRMVAFGMALPGLRKRVEDDLALPGLPKEKVIAAVVRLLETTLIRVGNEEYARQNRSYGLTTLRDRHMEVEGSKLQFSFKGKSRKKHNVVLTDRRLAKIVQRCQELPGQELFQCVDDDGEQRTVTSEDVNDYLREVTGQEFTAKDFRTWAGTVIAALALQEFESFDNEAQAKKNIVSAIQTVAERLGNTPAICRKSYVHPQVIDAYLDGSLLAVLKQRADKMSESLSELRPEEAAVLALLQRRFAEETGKE